MEEEPPSKVSKFDMSAEYLDESFDDEPEDEQDDGQEEWLSEEILTDDDFSVDKNTTVKEENANSHNSQGPQQQKTQNPKSKKDEIPDDLDEFLIKKTAVKIDKDKVKDKKVKEKKLIKKKEKVDEDATDAGSSDSGNDTDDLLRMLGDDVKKNIKGKDGNKKSEKKRAAVSSGESSEDESSLNNTKQSRMNAVSKNGKKASIAEPEESDTYSEMSSEDEDVEDLKKMFAASKAGKSKDPPSKILLGSKKKPTSPIKEYPGKLRSQQKLISDNKQKTTKNTKTSTVSKSSPVNKPSPVTKPSSKLSPGSILKLRQVPKPNVNIRSPLPSPKSVTPSPKKTSSKPLAFAQKVKIVKTPNQSSPKVVVPKSSSMQRKAIFDEIIDEDDFNESDDVFDLDDELGMNSDDDSKVKLRLMEPEKMDEEMPSDFDSSEEDSYSEILSSDSEDDWFRIDIRAEKAADYLPMLGSKAYEVLTQEKERIGARLRELKKSVRALSESSKRQAEQVRDATAALGEIEGMIKAA